MVTLMKWYERYPAMVDRERARIRQSFSNLALDTATDGEAIVSGVIEVVPDAGFSTHLIVPNSYPNRVPSLKCNPKEIPWNVDRHVDRDGVACLCVASEYRTHWPPGSDITDFLSSLVVPYFVAQLYYDAHGQLLDSALMAVKGSSSRIESISSHSVQSASGPFTKR